MPTTGRQVEILAGRPPRVPTQAPWLAWSDEQAVPWPEPSSARPSQRALAPAAAQPPQLPRPSDGLGGHAEAPERARPARGPRRRPWAAPILSNARGHYSAHVARNRGLWSQWDKENSPFSETSACTLRLWCGPARRAPLLWCCRGSAAVTSPGHEAGLPGCPGSAAWSHDGRRWRRSERGLRLAPRGPNVGNWASWPPTPALPRTSRRARFNQEKAPEERMFKSYYCTTTPCV